ncbi:MAG: hypothetical protein HJJLKODD_02394 [Phycisphaerae bacterium]|nr:hypothetical protein [Phycisphaerae bacterium]
MSILLVLLLALLLQIMLLPCLCSHSQIKIMAAVILDVAVLVRMLIAVSRNESGYWLRGYAVLLITSCLWIDWLIEGLF